MAKKTKAKGRKKPLKRVKDKGALFDGGLPDKIPALERKCDQLAEAREACGKARLNAKEKEAEVLDMMHEAGIKQYRHEASGKVFQIDAPEKVKFKSMPKAESGNGINPPSEDDDSEEEEVLESNGEAVAAE